MSHPGNSAILERLYEEAIEMGLDEDAAILYAERKMEEMEFLEEILRHKHFILLIKLF